LLVTIADKPTASQAELDEFASKFKSGTFEPNGVEAVALEFCVDSGFRGACDLVAPSDGVCTNVPADFNDRITSYNVQGGCCGFYLNGNCDGALFTATNRADGDLEEHGNNDVISSYLCSTSRCPF